MAETIIVSILTGIPLGILGGILGAKLAMRKRRWKIMSEREDLEVLRYAFLSDWVKEATHEEIVQKLILSDERKKKLDTIKELLKDY